MATNDLRENDLKILNEENHIHDENFQEFHKKIFEHMLNEAVFLAFGILKNNGKRPGVGDFDDELTELTKKISLLGTYIKNDFLVQMIKKHVVFNFLFWFI